MLNVFILHLDLLAVILNSNLKYLFSQLRERRQKPTAG